jgi:hypothetical protein
MTGLRVGNLAVEAGADRWLRRRDQDEVRAAKAKAWPPRPPTVIGFASFVTCAQPAAVALWNLRTAHVMGANVAPQW